eukprot:TRINITY_DN3403_c0_g1_i1.p1 TRINITY_DN3403_c0_g1~~TRINITY_DN3403_c0_g1_i1.p1  ORF type:complete len:127 (-),score=14.31 TRINITY_DN3403_c0_g1_i1:113-493(-)
MSSYKRRFFFIHIIFFPSSILKFIFIHFFPLWTFLPRLSSYLASSKPLNQLRHICFKPSTRTISSSSFFLLSASMCPHQQPLFAPLQNPNYRSCYEKPIHEPRTYATATIQLKTSPHTKKQTKQTN